MTSKTIRLRYRGACSRCALDLPAGTRASWDSDSRLATCLACLDRIYEKPTHLSGDTETTDAPPPPAAPVAGSAGASARREYERRHHNRETKIDQRWGRFAGVVKFISEDPQSTRAWIRGSEGERRLAEGLTKRVGDRAILLHDRRVPRSRANIDHIAIAASGVWAIDAKTYTGKVERRDKGGWFSTDLHLYVGGRDRAKLVEGMRWQVEAVRNALANVGIPVMAALCFIDAEWSLFAKPFQLDTVWVTWGKALAEMIAVAGPLTKEDVLRIAEQLAVTLPPA